MMMRITAPALAIVSTVQVQQRRVLIRLAWIFAIGIITLTAQAARAQIITLPLTLHWQQTGQWCWAASGQMLMDFFGPRDVPQCYQANQEFGRTDCCSCPTPGDCVQPGWPQFDTWGYNATTTNWGSPLSWSQVIAEINAGRPFMFSWAWNGGGGHAMVAYGYFNFSLPPFPFVTFPPINWVFLANPWGPQGRCGPGGNASGPFGGDDEIVTYSEFVGGPGYDHTHGADIYNISHM